MSNEDITNWPGLNKLGTHFVEALKAEYKGGSLNDLLGQISHESNFEAGAGSSSSTAAGLVQMIDSTAKRYAGVTSAELRKMTAVEQIPGIVNYFTLPGYQLQGADFLMMGLSRNKALLTAPDSAVIYAAGSPAALGNAHFTDKFGAITVGAVRKNYAKWRSGMPTSAWVPKSVQSDSDRGFPGFLLVIGAIGLACKLLR